MVTVISESQKVSVPNWVVDLESFRRWMDSDDVPEHYRVSYLKGEVWIDMSKEQVFTHVQVKTEFTVVVGGLARRTKCGVYLTDGVRLSHEDADLSCNPDGVFVSTETLQQGRVRLIEGMEEGHVELEGAPDMVLEVVSTGSVHKDTVVLRQAYWDAGIREYWLVDVRKEVRFDILRHTARGYAATRRQGGWLRSAVFAKSFRLTRAESTLGHPDFELEAR